MKENRTFDLQIVGNGPAGCGVMVAAARDGRLTELVDGGDGIAFIEADPAARGQGSINKYNIFSNSPPKDFLDGIREGDLAEVLETEIGRRFLAYEDADVEIVHLSEVAYLQREIGARVGASLESSRLSQIFNSKIGFVRRVNADGVPLYLSHDADSPDRVVAASRHLLLATGGVQSPTLDLDKNSEKRILSNDVISGGPKLNEIVAALKANPNVKITIVGALHSGFSAAWKILEALNGWGIRVRDGAIRIVARQPVRLFYKSSTEALAANYDFDPEQDVCQETDKVNRFGGIRGNSKRLFLDVQKKRERRVEVLEMNDKFVLLCDESAFIVEAIGYSANKIPILDENGREIGPQLDSNKKFVNVDQGCNVFDLGGELIPSAYAMGLGHGVSAGNHGEPAFKGRLDAVNWYQEVGGRIIASKVFVSRK